MIKKFLATLGLVLALYAPSVAGLIFDGTDDNVHYGDIPAIDDATKLSCSMWVYLDDLLANYIIMASAPGSTVGFNFRYDLLDGADARIWFFNVRESAGAGTDENNVKGQTDSASSGVWEHVFWSFEAGSATGLQLWVDGTETTNGSPRSAALIADAGKGGGNIIFGENNSGGGDLPGRIAEVGCWDEILTDPEIVSLSKGFSPPLIRPSALIFYAPMIGKTQQDNDLTGNGAAPTYANQTASTPHPRVLR